MIEEIPEDLFKVKYKLVHDSIFSGRPVDKQPFQDATWSKVLLPMKVFFGSPYTMAIAESAKICGDEFVIVTECEAAMARPHKVSALGYWTPNILDEIDRAFPTLNAVDNDVFGPTGSWGMIRYYDDYSCIAGKDVFMESLVSKLGGIEQVRAEFIQYCKDLFPLDYEFVDKLLASVDWDGSQ